MMKAHYKPLLAASLLAATSVACAAEEAGSFSRAEIEAIVRDYIMANPQVMLDSVMQLQQKQQAEAIEAQRKALRDSKASLLEDSRDPVVGAAAKDADVTIVEFFDYNCGYCKRTTPELLSLVDKDKKVRVVMKEFPILSQESTLAAKYALAVYKLDPSRYPGVHAELMAAKGPKTAEALAKLVEAAGLDPDKVKKAAEDPAIDQHIAENRVLANRIGVSGTPAFVIGDQLMATAMNKAMLEEQIKALRQPIAPTEKAPAATAQ
jgi:protein-disulfide isomerase